MILRELFVDSTFLLQLHINPTTLMNVQGTGMKNSHSLAQNLLYFVLFFHRVVSLNHAIMSWWLYTSWWTATNKLYITLHCYWSIVVVHHMLHVISSLCCKPRHSNYMCGVDYNTLSSLKVQLPAFSRAFNWISQSTLEDGVWLVAMT